MRRFKAMTKNKEKQEPRERGVFERPAGSGTWWVRYTDQHGRLHREKVGPKSLAKKVYQSARLRCRSIGSSRSGFGGEKRCSPT